MAAGVTAAEGASKCTCNADWLCSLVGVVLRVAVAVTGNPAAAAAAVVDRPAPAAATTEESAAAAADEPAPVAAAAVGNPASSSSTHIRTAKHTCQLVGHNDIQGIQLSVLALCPALRG